MKKCFNLFALASILLCLNACNFSNQSAGDSEKHPTGNPREDASVYRELLNSGNVMEANQFADEVRDLYMQDFVNDRGKKIDEFWEWNAKLK